MAGNTLPRGGIVYGTVIPASVLVVCVLAALQHLVVLHVPVVPSSFVIPTLVGALFGSILARVIVGRRREAYFTEALAARERSIAALNNDLVALVEERTRELERRTSELMEAQRMEVVGRLAGGLAHDFNNMLGVLTSCAEVMKEATSRGTVPPEVGEVLGDVDSALATARSLTSQLLTLSRRRPPERRRVNLAALVEQIRPVLQRLLGDTGRVVVEQDDGPHHVIADAAQLERALLNLTGNARDAMPDGGSLTLSVRRTADDVTLQVADSGVGMDEATQRRVFEPLFTTKPEGQGTGLGLAVVHEVVTQVYGRIDVASTPGVGTTFTLRFPRAGDAEVSPRSEDGRGESAPPAE